MSTIKLKGLEHIQRTRDYLDYLENHFHNVAKAHEILLLACHDHLWTKDWDFLDNLAKDVMNHDLSKFSSKEFTQYRKRWKPTFDEKNTPSRWQAIQMDSDLAFIHHLMHNDHHVQNWGKKMKGDPTDDDYRRCVHMVIDWTAMSLRFSDTPLEYYEKSKEKELIPKKMVSFLEIVLQDIHDYMEKHIRADNTPERAYAPEDIAKALGTLGCGDTLKITSDVHELLIKRAETHFWINGNTRGDTLETMSFLEQLLPRKYPVGIRRIKGDEQ